jgi:thiol:disulfide interchange protein
VKRRRGYSLKVKRETILAGALTVLTGALLLAESGCRGREEGASPAGAPLDHSKKSPSSSSSSLPFISISFEAALERARAEKKLVFVDVYADWCTWCTKMDEDVFIDSRVRAALLDFIPIKVDADKGGGRAVANRYRVSGLPAFLLIDGDGKVVGRFDGYWPVEPFLAKLGRAAGGRL